MHLGIYSINEVRELEDRDKIDNGDKHYMSLNYIDIDLMNEYQKGKIKNKSSPNKAAGNSVNESEDGKGGVKTDESEGN